MFGEMKFLPNSKLCKPQQVGVDIQDMVTQGFHQRTIRQAGGGIGQKSEVFQGTRGRMAGKRQRLGGKSRYLSGARTRTKEGIKNPLPQSPRTVN